MWIVPWFRLWRWRRVSLPARSPRVSSQFPDPAEVCRPRRLWQANISPRLTDSPRSVLARSSLCKRHWWNSLQAAPVRCKAVESGLKHNFRSKLSKTWDLWKRQRCTFLMFMPHFFHVLNHLPELWQTLILHTDWGWWWRVAEGLRILCPSSYLLSVCSVRVLRESTNHLM